MVDDHDLDYIDSNRNRVQAAIQYFMQESLHYNISTTLGGSYDFLYAGLRFRHFKDYGTWHRRFTNHLRYHSDDGWENKASLDLERQLSQRKFFRAITTATWQKDKHNISHSQLFKVYQMFNVQG